MQNNQMGFIATSSKKPTSDYSRTTKPVGSQKTGSNDKPNPNYVPPASQKKSEWYV